MKAEYGMSVEVAPNDWRRSNLILDGKEGETPEQLLDRTANTVEEWFRLRNGVKTSDSAIKEVINHVISVEKSPDPNYPNIIRGCKTLKDLLTYKTIVGSNPALKAIYNKKHTELSKQLP